MHRTAPDVEPVRRGPLRPAELAEAVVLADVSLALIVVGQVLPLGSILLIAAVVPLTVVGARHRLRAVIAGSIAASIVGFLVIGTAALTAMAACATLGALVGAAFRRGWSERRTTVFGLGVLWPPIAALADLALLVFADLRKLTLENVRNAWNGLFHLLGNMRMGIAWLAHHPGIVGVVAVVIVVRTAYEIRRGYTTVLNAVRAVVVLAMLLAGLYVVGGFESRGKDAVATITRNWWITVPVVLFVAMWFGIWLTYGLATPALRRVQSAFGRFGGDHHDEDPEPEVDADGNAEIAPVPAHLEAVHYRYANATRDALTGVDLDVRAGEMLAVVGPNGSGKSTLARVIAGRLSPTGGHVARPGPVGLGRAHGTAIVFQRPEAQVLGVRVRDDVVWGLDSSTRAQVDVDAVLERVGLRALADRETSTLSGGELQRLAVAAALARAPRLLVSDEATAMVDTDGRAQLVALLRTLATDDGIGVVHVTHHPREAALADRVIALADGMRVAPGPLTNGGLGYAHDGAPPPGTNAIIDLHAVGHVYSRGTPWANRALRDISLTVYEGEALLVVGHNGSGKSTLAWILAGLLAPSEGDARLDGDPVTEHVGEVALSFQHARLQLLRPTVLDEVHTAAAVDRTTADAALVAVGLDPAVFGGKRVDELSGGQMRRVVLAGALAHRPRALVLDEPFAGLDPDGCEELRALLARIRDERKVALVIISHDPDLASDLVDRVIELDQGRVVRDRAVGDTSGALP